MSEITISEISIAELPTKQVIIAPKQVTIVREIHTTIQPGQNEITILGLDPNVNRDSIRIEGAGPATITDIQASVVPQPEDFDDVYPVESGEEPLSDEDEDVSEDEDGLDDPELQEIRKEMEKVELEVSMAQSAINASVAVLKIMNEYGKGLQNDESKDVKKFEDFLNIYSTRRDAEAERHHKAIAEGRVHEKELAKLRRKYDRRRARYLQEQRAASKAMRLRNEKRARAREKKKKQRERKRSEQRHFWASNVGQVVVSLDSQAAAFTPGSSRRSSVVEKVGEDAQEAMDIILRLSYIVPQSSWTSRYELRINSPSSSARMTYRAEFQNWSTETWRDTQVTLSTSQASFNGIGARIPSLDSWNIKLATGFADSKAPSWDRILDAPKSSLGPPPPPFSRGLFGAPAPQVPADQQGSLIGGAIARAQAATAATQGSVPAAQSSGLFGASSSTSGFGALASQSQGGLFGSAPSQPQPAQQPQPTSNNLFGAPPAQQQVPAGQPVKSLFGQAAGAIKGTDQQPQQENQSSLEANTAVELEDESDTQSLTSGPLGHQDSVKQDYGMTTTYELPGRRTLSPSFVSRRHVLAELDLKTVTLTYVIVPKHREAAFLRARIKNTSSLTLHPGQVGITVDGSFVGNASVETCGPNVFFNISLGVDPRIEVKYAKPVVRPVTGAMFFNKEDAARFGRSCWVKNTKTVAVDLVVSDQVPVSDDEKLRVRLLQPSGLDREGDEAPLQIEKGKGNGSASLLKNGEVKWTLRLEPREEIRLVLEYEAKVPSGSDFISS
ncbi:hypothetical protein BDW62DRAFT_138928 [Aspergillus aurantiobrunneus]